MKSEQLDKPIDPICQRIEEIIEVKRQENKAMVGTLKSLDDVWKSLNKGFDEAIGKQFEYIAFEKVVSEKALDLVKKGQPQKNKEGFVFSGKVMEKEKKVGLPGIRMRVLRVRTGQKDEVLAETTSDGVGNFEAVVPRELCPVGGINKEAVKIMAFADSKQPIHTEKRSIGMKSGGAKELKVSIPPNAKLADRLEAAKSIQDSIAENVEIVGKRIQNMKTAHTAVTRFANVTRDGLRELRKELSSKPPEISEVLGE